MTSRPLIIIARWIGRGVGPAASSGPGRRSARNISTSTSRVERQAEERDRAERREERAVADLRQAGDQHVLRVAGDRGDAADVRAGGERQQVGQRPVPARARQLDQDRREDQADRVVDEQRREDAADEDDGDEQQRRLVHAGADPLHRGAEESRHAQVRDEHHHAEEQHQGAEVDVPVGLVERDDAGGDHQRGADDGGAGAVDSQVGCAADGEDEVGEEEDGARDDREEHARGSYIGPGAEVVAGAAGRPAGVSVPDGCAGFGQSVTLGVLLTAATPSLENERFRAPCSSVAQR